MKTRVGFIGLGQMGLPMAVNILKKEGSLCVYNRTKEKAKTIIEKGAHWVDSPQHLAEESEIVVTMVANDEALKEIVEGEFGILNCSNKPKIHISMSTVSPHLVTNLEKKHQEKGIGFLAAPVSGRPERAQQGALWIFLSGRESEKKEAIPILELMSVKIFDLGTNPSQAALFKLCNNFMILSFIESFTEAAALLEKGGISIEKAGEIWGSSLFDSPVLHSYMPMLSKGNFADGGFALDLGLKDMRLLHECADKANVPMPFLGDLHEKLLASMNAGRERYDWSAIAMLTRELAGL